MRSATRSFRAPPDHGRDQGGVDQRQQDGGHPGYHQDKAGRCRANKVPKRCHPRWY